jgi:transcriptional/translational regulatory protein YebC/TACO1
VIAIARDGLDADEVALAAIDAGAEDVDTEADDFIEVLTDPANLESLRRTLEEAGVKIESAELTMQPKQRIEVDEDVVRQNLRLLESLDDLEDVQRVTANFDLPAEVLAEVSAT